MCEQSLKECRAISEADPLFVNILPKKTTFLSTVYMMIVTAFIKSLKIIVVTYLTLLPKKLILCLTINSLGK